MNTANTADTASTEGNSQETGSEFLAVDSPASPEAYMAGLSAHTLAGLRMAAKQKQAYISDDDVARIVRLIRVYGFPGALGRAMRRASQPADRNRP